MSLPSTPGWTALHLMVKFPLLSLLLGTAYYFWEPAPRPMIAITFDDGRKSVIETAMPILEEKDVIATAYITTGLLGQPTYMSSEDVVTISKAGWEIGGHTYDHPSLLTLDAKGLEAHLLHSKQYLTHLTGQPVNAFASPYGEYNDQIIQEISKYYESHVNAFDEFKGITSFENFDKHEISRLDITKEVSPEQVCKAVSELKSNQLFTIIFHDVVDLPGNWNTDIETFTKIVNCISDSDVDVVTISEAISIIEGNSM